MSDTQNLLPLHHKEAPIYINIFKKNRFCSFTVPFPIMGWSTLISMLFSFFFCVFWSILYNFEEANATHCAVENFFPSISASIGSFYPQIYVWNTSILFHMLPRLKISTMYFHYYTTVILERNINLCYVTWMFHTCELWALMGLSFVTSTNNYSKHLKRK